ncbi:hypothetical protein D9619_009476 [Psilocybe cf. subviscida]|uniref:F-box domain-containing protein n=1 Tax=Psilocybe cf. subviscida TaxID=2480587 RepID=A0A8H5BVW1_9AGAR|nr:hypothetical protein D9619_009476 [Psilocybe cf. subviscida]
MATVNNLPTELLCQIFENVFSSSNPLPFDYTRRRLLYQTQRATDISSCDCATLDTIWNYEEFGHVTMSPFTLARVCTRWYDIVSYFTHFWTHLVIDVSRPIRQRQFEAFELCYPHPFMLYIFSNMYLPKEEENRRVLAIMDALKSHINRCVSIVFRIQYASSLPHLSLLLSSPGLRLEEIRMECRTQDFIPALLIRLDESVSHLQYISVNGRTFMSLCYSDTNQLAQFGSVHPLSLRVSDLTLHRNEFRIFMTILDGISANEVFLSNVTLSTRPLKRRNIERTYDHITELFEFSDVCPTFISDFFNSSSFDYVYLFRIIGCRIPRMRARLPEDGLELRDIPRDAAPALPDQSIRNILSVFEGSTLDMSRCVSLTDDTLGWLATRDVARRLLRMSVRDCPNITPLGVRHLLTMRHGCGSYRKLIQFFATGEMQPLDEDDLYWFSRWKRESTTNIIRWPNYIF